MLSMNGSKPFNMWRKIQWNYTKEGYTQLINEDNDESYEKKLEKINIGHLVPLNCGHNGAMSIEESDMFEMYLSQSNFIKLIARLRYYELMSRRNPTFLI